MAHAILAPSSASRWTVCTPSARLEEVFPDNETEFAREGTLAHSVAELMLKTGDHILQLADYKKFKEDELFNDTLYEHAQDYAEYVREHSGPEIFVERHLSLSDWIPEGFGHGDAASLNLKILHVFDLKYGKGVLVEIMGNKQLRIYALGWLRFLSLFIDIAEIETVRMHIYQPRLNNIGYEDIAVKELLRWGEEELKPKAEIAFAGEGDQIPGDHCRFCRAQATCKGLADYSLEIAKKRFIAVPYLTDEEVTAILKDLPIFLNWVKTLSEYALNEALKGKDWPGYKLVEGVAKRRYSDEQKIADKLRDTFVTGNPWKPKELLNFEELTALIGKHNFDKYVNPLLITPEGKPTLVPESDKRKPYNPAAKVFNDGYSETVNKFF